MFPLHDDVPSERFPFVTYALIVANVLAFFLELGAGPHLVEFVRTWAVVPRELVPALLFSGDAQALITPFTAMFLHGGWLHLIGNVWFLYIFGDNVEGRLGHFWYLVFYLAAGVGATGLQVAIDARSAIPQLGASGAIAGVLGAYMVMFPHSRVLTLLLLGFFVTTWRIGAPWFLGIWFGIQALSGLAALGMQTGGGVAWWAHIGGFVVGFAVGLLFRNPPRNKFADRWYSNRV